MSEERSGMLKSVEAHKQPLAHRTKWLKAGHYFDSITSLMSSETAIDF
jgi:hypothetical protein